MATTDIDGYYQGDAYHFTGETVEEYGRTWLQAVMLDGHNKGKIISLPRPEDVERSHIARQEAYERQQAAYGRLRAAGKTL